MTVTVSAGQYHAARTVFRAEARHAELHTGRYRMRYFVWGSGSPVVFIHGMADHATAFLMVMHDLVSRFTCIGYELPDGLTDGSRLARYTLGDYTADLLALLDHLGFARAAVLGSSFGSVITLAALATAPDRFSHGVIQNGFAYRPLNCYQRQLARMARFWPGWFADWPGIHRAVMRLFEGEVLSSLPSEVAHLMLRHGGRNPIRAVALRSLTIDRTDLRHLLPTIRVPLLLLTGDQDRLVPRSCWSEIESLARDVRRVEFAGCGHYPQYTHPGPMVEAIGRFLSSGVTTSSGVTGSSVTGGGRRWTTAGHDSRITGGHEPLVPRLEQAGVGRGG